MGAGVLGEVVKNGRRYIESIQQPDDTSAAEFAAA